MWRKWGCLAQKRKRAVCECLKGHVEGPIKSFPMERMIILSISRVQNQKQWKVGTKRQTVLVSGKKCPTKRGVQMTETLDSSSPHVVVWNQMGSDIPFNTQSLWFSFEEDSWISESRGKGKGKGFTGEWACKRTPRSLCRRTVTITKITPMLKALSAPSWGRAYLGSYSHLTAEEIEGHRVNVTCPGSRS